MIDMTREKAAAVAKALNDVEDFELFFDAVEIAFYNTEGDMADFFENQLVPLMKTELARRKQILEEM